jgi:spermidine synthase
MSNSETLFWKFIKKSGENGEKINKIRKHYKQKYGSKFIKQIDTIFESYYDRINYKIDLPEHIPSYESIIKEIVFHILSKGKKHTKKFINTPFKRKEISSNKGTINFTITENLFNKHSEFQHIEIVKTKRFGRTLLIDNDINVTELDEKNYHEMIVHVPMAYKLNAKKALIIGGGDGGTARELLKYKNLDITMIEIDKVVIEAAKLHLPSTAISYQNPRLNLIIDDGAKFIKNYSGEKFDIIIVDSTDFNRAIVLFTKEFYTNIFNNLKEDGVLVFNNDSVVNDEHSLILNPTNQLKKIFKFVFPYQLFMPSYYSGHYTMMFCSKTIHPINTKVNSKDWCALNISTEYYNLGVHLGSFYLPNSLSKKLNDKLTTC